MSKLAIFAILVAAPLASVAAANPVDNYAADAIAHSDYATAEAQLNAYLRTARNDPPALLNLAYVYRHTHRVQEANKLYQRILARLDMDVARSKSGTPLTAHAIARANMAPNLTFASR
jgi:Flp pilus assembly protein TadD